MKVLLFATLLSAFVLAGCSKTANPEVCCTDPADCSSIGATEDMRACPTGLACIDHECVVSECSTQGCTAQAPVCNVATNVCEGCTGNVDCSTTQSQPLCDVDSGACVQCLTSPDCGPTVPVCSNLSCRKCELDSECTSGACDDDGSCVPEQRIVYMFPAGTDSGSCTSSQPCRTLPFAVSKTSAQRSHIVMRFGSYSAEQITISTPDTTASPLVLHGGGSVLTAGSGDGALLTIDLPITIRDLELESLDGYAVVVGPTPSLLDQIKIRSRRAAVLASGNLTMRDFVIEESTLLAGYGIQMGQGSLILERGVFRGWDSAIKTNGTPALDITNVLFYGSRLLSLDVPSASGTIRFSTIADSGQDAGTGARAIQCSFNLTIQSSIVWAPGGTPRPAVTGCNLASSIIGPTPVAGSSNADPQFVNPAARDYHLKAGSPARDMVDVGPMLDFERDPRPQGARYDIGADEGGQ